MSRRAPSRRQVRGLLVRAGFRVAPPPRPTFVASLAGRLAAAGAVGLHGAVVFALPARARRQLPIVAAALAAMAAAVLTAAFSGWFGRGSDQQVLALAAAVDTTVVLPNGTSVAGRSGLELPDGTVVRTGPRGRASAGDVEIGPTLEALVDAGHLRLRPAGDVATDKGAVSPAALANAPSTTSTTKTSPTSVSTITTRPATVTTVRGGPPTSSTTAAGSSGPGSKNGTKHETR